MFCGVYLKDFQSFWQRYRIAVQVYGRELYSWLANNLELKYASVSGEKSYDSAEVGDGQEKNVLTQWRSVAIDKYPV